MHRFLLTHIAIAFLALALPGQASKRTEESTQTGRVALVGTNERFATFSTWP